MQKIASKTYKEIERLARCTMSKKEVESILELPQGTLSTDTKATDCYNRGFLKSKAELRASIITLANSGSSQAQELATKFIEETNLENVMYGQ